MFHINGVLAFTNKLREIGRPMSDLHIINIIMSMLPESFARAQSNWMTCVPEAERTVARLTSNLKAEETIIKSHAKSKEVALVANQNTSIFRFFLNLLYILTMLIVTLHRSESDSGSVVLQLS